MAGINAVRMNGLGNNFIIVDRRIDSVNIPKEKILELGKRTSFHRDITFDQIIFIEKEIDKAFPITIFNSDGSEISACGNGSRCIAYLISKENKQKTVKLEAEKKILEAEILSEKLVRINMGLPKFEDDKSIPIKKGLDPRKV